MSGLRSPTRCQARAAVALAIGLATACSLEAKPNELGFSVTFACDSDRMETDSVRLRVLAGGCHENGAARYEATLTRGDEAPTVDPVGPGRYGVEAIAYAEEDVLASTCLEV